MRMQRHPHFNDDDGLVTESDTEESHASAELPNQISMQAIADDVKLIPET